MWLLLSPSAASGEGHRRWGGGRSFGRLGIWGGNHLARSRGLGCAVHARAPWALPPVQVVPGWFWVCEVSVHWVPPQGGPSARRQEEGGRQGENKAQKGCDSCFQVSKGRKISKKWVLGLVGGMRGGSQMRTRLGVKAFRTAHDGLWERLLGWSPDQRASCKASSAPLEERRWRPRGRRRGDINPLVPGSLPGGKLTPPPAPPEFVVHPREGLFLP